MCEPDSKVLPDELHELELSSFSPERCIELLKPTEDAPFDPEREFCAGFVYKKRKRKFHVDGGSEDDDVTTFKELDDGVQQTRKIDGRTFLCIDFYFRSGKIMT